jgi:hypothetical protein
MSAQGTLGAAERRDLLAKLAALPESLAALVVGLSADQLTTAYLPGEWTVAQIVHHLADSHLNAYVRAKHIITQDQASLQPYDQERWAELADAGDCHVDDSLRIVAGLHHRWVRLLTSLPDAVWEQTAHHPESGLQSLADILRTYAHHGELHLAQIEKTLAAASD